MIELFIAGLVLAATYETPFDTFLRLWSHDLARAWEHESHVQRWLFQQHGWGDPSRGDE